MKIMPKKCRKIAQSGHTASGYAMLNVLFYLGKLHSHISYSFPFVYVVQERLHKIGSLLGLGDI